MTKILESEICDIKFVQSEFEGTITDTLHGQLKGVMAVVQQQDQRLREVSMSCEPHDSAKNIPNARRGDSMRPGNHTSGVANAVGSIERQGIREQRPGRNFTASSR
jgi:hypothetical protein